MPLRKPGGASTKFSFMKKVMIKRLNMYRQVSGVIQEHSSDWAQIGVFGSIVTRFDAELKDFESLMSSSENVQKGVRAAKDSLQSEVFEKFIDLSRILKIYGVQNMNAALVAQMKPVPIEIRRSSKQKALVMIELILTMAEEHLPDLGSYGITQDLISELTILKNKYAASIHTTRKAIIDRKSMISLLQAKNKELGSILSQELDPFVKSMKAQIPIFYTHYFAARTVERRSSSNQSPTTEVPEPDDGE